MELNPRYENAQHQNLCKRNAHHCELTRGNVGAYFITVVNKQMAVAVPTLPKEEEETCKIVNVR